MPHGVPHTLGGPTNVASNPVTSAPTNLLATGSSGWIDALNSPWVFRAALLLVGLLYLSSITPHWYPSSDSALYLMLSDNLLAGQGYTLWGRPHIHVPPGFPLLLAGLKSIGVDSYLGLNAVMVLLTCGALALCYLALCEMVSPTLAKCLTLLVAFSHVTHHTSACILSDIPFMALVWLGLYCQLHGLRTGKWTLELGTLLLLASCGVRIVGVPLALGAAWGLWVQHGSNLPRRRVRANVLGIVVAILLVVGTAIFAMLLVSKGNALPSYMNSLVVDSSQLWKSGFIKPVFNLMKTGLELATLLTGQKHAAIGYFIGLLWVPIVVGMIVCWQRGQRYGVCILSSYLLALLMMRPLVARYLLPVSPLIFWFFLEGTRFLVDRSRQWQPRGAQVVLACVIVMLACSVPKAVKLVHRIHHPETDSSYVRHQNLTKVAKFLGQAAKPGELFVTNKDERLLAYLSGIWTIPLAEKKISRRTPNDEILASAITPDVRFVVVSDFGKKLHVARLRALISTRSGTRLAFRVDAYQVYKLAPPDIARDSISRQAF